MDLRQSGPGRRRIWRIRDLALPGESADAGRLEIGGRSIDLQSLALPILNLIGQRDHLVPPASSAALQHLVGSKDYTALEFDLGHIGMYISARAQREVPAAIAKWLSER